MLSYPWQLSQRTPLLQRITATRQYTMSPCLKRPLLLAIGQTVSPLLTLLPKVDLLVLVVLLAHLPQRRLG